jgi:hypothetical protein
MHLGFAGIINPIIQEILIYCRIYEELTIPKLFRGSRQVMLNPYH